VQPEAARELGERKAAAILATGAECVVSTNPGCLMQVKSGLKRSGSVIETAHLAEILDISISGRRRRPANG
jgi:glycolate oxidase iron-sulfur subunit